MRGEMAKYCQYYLNVFGNYEAITEEHEAVSCSQGCP